MRKPNWLFIAMYAVWSGCAQDDMARLHGPDPDADGVFGFQVERAALLDGGVLAYRVRLYRKVPSDWTGESPYFYSDCNLASGAFLVDGVKTGTGYVVVYEGYSDPPEGTGDKSRPVCKTLSALGVRGEIVISSSGTGDAYYYIPLYRKDAFSAFPLPGPDLDPPSGGLKCGTDADCRAVQDCEIGPDCPNGKKYVFHPAATCDGGFCRLASLFPLNVPSGRAFLTSVATPLGTTFSLGGFETLDATRLSANDTSIVVFNANTYLFESPPLAGLDQPLAMSASAEAASVNLVAILGGVPSIRFKDLKDILAAKAIPCAAAQDCPLKPAAVAFGVDVARNVSKRYALPLPGFGGLAAMVRGPDGGPMILYRPGFVQTSDTEITPGDRAYRFAVASNGVLSCVAPLPEEDPSDAVLACAADEGLTPRAAATGVCLDDTSGICDKFLVLGGHDPQAGPAEFAEVFDAASQTFFTLKGDAGLPKTLSGAVAWRDQARVWMFGGHTHEKPATVYAFTVDLSAREIHQAAAVSTDDLSDLRRVFHQVTPLSDRRTLLITGGLSEDEVLSSYLLVRLENDHLTVAGRGSMNEPRLGHTAIRLLGGILKDSVLVSGGVRVLAEQPALARGAELYLSLP